MTGVTCDFNSATVNQHAGYTDSAGDNLLQTPCFKHVHSSLHDKDTHHILISSSDFTAVTPQSFVAQQNSHETMCIFTAFVYGSHAEPKSLLKNYGNRTVMTHVIMSQCTVWYSSLLNFFLHSQTQPSAAPSFIKMLLVFNQQAELNHHKIPMQCI